MALISIKRNVDLQPGLNAPAVFNCSQSDKGTTIMLGLMNGGNDYTVPSGVTITIRGSRSNGAVFTPVSATFSGSTVSFTLTEEMTDTAGPTLCEAVLEQGNNVLGTANFIINVEGSPMGADVPPIFTDAAWAWMLGKLTTETVPALGDDVISSIQGKVDKSQGSTNAKKFLRVNTSGNVSLASTDKTLSVADQIADAKETGDQIRALDAAIDGVVTTFGGSISTLNGITTDLQSSKLDKNQGASNAGEVLMVNQDGTVSPAAVDLSGKANESTIAPEFDPSGSYTAGQYVYKNGVLYKFISDHTGAWTGTDTVVVTVGGEVECISEYDSIDSSGFEILPYYINGSVLGPVTPARLFVIPSSKLTDIRFICSISSTKRVGFVDSVANNATVYNSAEYTGTIDVTVQNTGNHAYFVVQLFINSDAQQDVSVYRSGITVKALSAVDIVARGLADDVRVLKDAFADPTQIYFQTSTFDNGIIGSSTNKWNTTSGNVSYFIPLNGESINTIEITAASNLQTIFAFLKTDGHVSGTTPDYATGAGRTVIAAGETASFSVPSDCRYITIVKGTSASSGDFTPADVTIYPVINGLQKTVNETSVAVSAVANLPDECIKSRCVSLWNVGNIEHGKLLRNTGATSSDSTYDTSDYIDVTKYKVLYGFGGRYCFYDESKTFITGSSDTFGNAPLLGNTTAHYVTVPDGAYYFRVCELKTGTKQVYAPSLYDEYLKDLASGTQATRKLYCLGDSITRGMYAEDGASSSSGPTAYGYPYWIGQYNNYDVTNLGNSGSGWANVGSAESQDDPSTARNAKDVVDDNTFADADIITMAWGVNDWKGAAQSVVLGDMTSISGDGTVIGNMKYCIETLVTKRPTAQLIVLLPLNTNRKWSGMRDMTLAENWAFGYPYRNNQTLEDYRTAIRQCAEYYNIKVIDLEEVCPINRLNIRNVCGDGLHPTKAFYKQMGQALANLVC